jgi:GT2 family glycosyltransferase
MSNSSSAGVTAAVVIVGGANGEWLRTAYHRAVAQTQSAAEIVIVDQFDTPGLARELLGDLAATPGVESVPGPDTRFAVPTGTGAATAYNAGVTATSAPAIVILDHHDTLHPEYLQRTGAVAAKREDLSFVSCARLEVGRRARRWKPPPYSVASALGRDECGQLATLFRREMWEHVGGFDESLGAFSEIDFWLTVIGAGFRGAILDDALVIRDERHGRAARLEGEHVLEQRHRLISRHLDASSPRGEDVFVALVGAERDLIAQRRALARENDQLGEQLARAAQEVEEARLRLGGHAVSMLTDQDPPGDRVPPAPERSEMEMILTELALRRLTPSEPPRRDLVLGPESLGQVEFKGAKDRVVLAGVLEQELDPLAAVERCRSHLRPGGHLIVIAASHTLAERALHGFTVAGLRHLMCQVFAPQTVRVESYGDLEVAIAHLPRRRRRRRGRSVQRPATAGRRAPALWAGVLTYGGRMSPAPAADLFSTQPNTQWLATFPAELERQMERLVQRFIPVSLTDLADQVRRRDVTPGAIAVTFDGAQVDLLRIVSPMLTEMQIPATLFAPPSLSDQPREAWQDVLDGILLGEETVPDRLTLDAGPLVGLDLPTRTRADRAHALHALLRRGEGMHDGERDSLTTQIRKWADAHDTVRESRRLMTATEVAAWGQTDGLDVGLLIPPAYLAACDSSDGQADWLSQVRESFEHRIGSPTRALAYDGTVCGIAVADVAIAAGFTVGCTREDDLISAGSDWMRLPRLTVGDIGWEVFAERLERLTLPGP